MVVQGPTDDDDENESQKAWTMEMLTNDGNISTSMTNEPEQISEGNKSSYMPGLYTQIIQYSTICSKKLSDKMWSMNIEA